MSDPTAILLYALATVSGATVVGGIWLLRLYVRRNRHFREVSEHRMAMQQHESDQLRAQVDRLTDLFKSQASFAPALEDSRERDLERIESRLERLDSRLADLAQQSRPDAAATFSAPGEGRHREVTTTANKLPSVYRQVASEFSHSIKTPLSSIDSAVRTFAEVMPEALKSSSLTSEQKQVMLSYLENAEISLDYIKKILQRGAGFFPGEPERFSLSDIVRKAVRIARETATSSPKVDLQDQGVPEISFYWANLLIAVIEVLENAFEAAGDARPQVQITASYDQSNAQVELLISNFGPPIPNTLKPRLFEVGSSTRGGNRGAGLAIARRCLESVGGSIGLVDSEAVGPTTFRITFSPKRVYAEAGS